MHTVHTQHVCRTSGRVEERGKGEGGSDRWGEYTALNALVDTYIRHCIYHKALKNCAHSNVSES